MKKITSGEKRFGFLRRTAKEVKQYRIMKKILCTAGILIIVVLAIFFVAASFYQNTGSFTVSVNKFEMAKYGLTLSENANMAYQTSMLNTNIEESMTNIAEEMLPANLDNADGSTDGAHNGTNYIAYTFYLKNAGDVAVSYEYTIITSNVTNGLDEAIRIRLYVNGTSVTYAKAKSDGTPEWNTTPFYSVTQVANGRVDSFEPNNITRFTIVIWIEGSDPECQDWLIGGKMKIDMMMSIVH